MIAAVESYLAVRRAAGFTLSNAEYLLRSFASFATEQDQTHIRTATAIDWASQAESLAQRHTRYQTVCRFAQYLRVEDSRHESPPENHFGYRKTRRVPYIYSRDEINSLILAATKLPSSDSLRPKTYAALISLLAATGLRISEALHLLVSDITPDGLLIRRTKFHKTRLVPLHDTAVAGLGHYLTRRQEIRRGGIDVRCQSLEISSGVCDQKCTYLLKLVNTEDAPSISSVRTSLSSVAGAETSISSKVSSNFQAILPSTNLIGKSLLTNHSSAWKAEMGCSEVAIRYLSFCGSPSTTL